MITVPVKARGAEWSWSISRHDSFYSCPRKYALHYYAANASPEIKRLKSLSSVPMWAGNVVHDFCETFLKTNNAVPSPEEQERLIKQVTHGQMPQDWRFSEAGTKRFRLFEHEYNALPTQEEKRAILGLVTRALRNFFNGSVLAEAFAVGRKEWLSCEDMSTYQAHGTKVYVKMDFAYRRPDGKVRIVDWKTGRTVGQSNRVQLAGYAVYALAQGWADKPEDIITTLVYLLHGEEGIKDETMDQRGIEKAKSFIEVSVGAMRSKLREPESNVAVIEDFPQKINQWNCKGCAFRRVCFPDGTIPVTAR